MASHAFRIPYVSGASVPPTIAASMTKLRSSHTADAMRSRGWRRARRRDGEHRAADAIRHANLTCWRTGNDPRHGERVPALRAFEVNFAIQHLVRLSPCRTDADNAAGSVSAVLE